MWESVIRERKPAHDAGAQRGQGPSGATRWAASGCAVHASQIPHSVSSWTIVRLMHPAAIRPPEGDV